MAELKIRHQALVKTDRSADRGSQGRDVKKQGD